MQDGQHSPFGMWEMEPRAHLIEGQTLWEQAEYK